MALNLDATVAVPKEEVLSKALFDRLLSDGIPARRVLCNLDPLNPFRTEYQLRVEFMGMEGQPIRVARAVFDLWHYQLAPRAAIDDLINSLESQYPKVLNPIPFTQ